MAQPAPGTTGPKNTTARKSAARKSTPGKPTESVREPSRHSSPEPPEDATEAVMGLDMLLVDAARGPLRRMIPPAGTTLRFGSALARQPGTVAKRAAELARELAAIAAGRSELAPGRKDKRFADPAWTGNPLLRRAMQIEPGNAAVRHALGLLLVRQRKLPEALTLLREASTLAPENARYA